MLQVAWDDTIAVGDLVDADFVTFQTPSQTNFEIGANVGVTLDKPPAAAFRLSTAAGTETGERVFPLRGLQYGPWMR